MEHSRRFITSGGTGMSEITIEVGFDEPVKLNFCWNDGNNNRQLTILEVSLPINKPRRLKFDVNGVRVAKVKPLDINKP